MKSRKKSTCYIDHHEIYEVMSRMGNKNDHHSRDHNYIHNNNACLSYTYQNLILLIFQLFQRSQFLSN